MPGLPFHLYFVSHFSNSVYSTLRSMISPVFAHAVCPLNNKIPLLPFRLLKGLSNVKPFLPPRGNVRNSVH